MDDLPYPTRSAGRWSARTVAPFVVFVFFLALWTYELLTPNPVPRAILDLIPVEWRFWLAKGLHVVGYAFLTVLAASLPVPRWVFWAVVAGLLLHGVATEVGQGFVNGRFGSVRDVILDWIGVGLGLGVLAAYRRLFGRRRLPPLPDYMRPPAGRQRLG